MTKTHTIDAIRSLNPTATPEFLADFSQDELAQYLDRLNMRLASDSRDDIDGRPAARDASPLEPEEKLPELWDDSRS